MADIFDRTRYLARLGTRSLGRELIVRESTTSTNDDAWEALAGPAAERGGEGADGVTVLALAQTRGRGRAGRTWTHAPGSGLALSVGLRLGGDVRQAGAIPLAAGLAVVRACHALGVAGARLKWPNDVLVDGRKLAGVLCEVRGTHPEHRPGGAVVIGIGLNVRTTREEFPVELRDTATSLVLEGSTASLEDAAAEILTRLEPLWSELQNRNRAGVLAEWSRWASHWGEWVRVRTPAGDIEGVAQRLDADGGLVLRSAAGVESTVLAGDVSASPEGFSPPILKSGPA